MLISLLLAVAAVPSSPSGAPSVDGVQEGGNVTVTPAQIFALADQLAGQGKPDDAIGLLKILTQDRNADYRAEARARIARLLIARGDLYEAANWYRRLLDEKPDAAAVRIELAALLARIGNEGAAARELQRAEAAGLPDAVSRSLRQARDFLKSRRPFGFNLSFGIAPDSNVNAATAADTIDIQGIPFQMTDGRARSGLGLTYSANAVSRIRLGPGARWISQLGSSGNLYRDSQFDDITLALDTGPELPFGLANIRPSVLIGRRYYMNGRLYDYVGANLSATLPVGKTSQVSFGLSHVLYDYAPAYAAQSGPMTSVQLGYDRAFTPRLIGHIGVTRTRTDAMEPGYAMTRYGGDASLRRDFKGLSLYAQASMSHARSDGPYLFWDRRDEHFYEGDLGLVFRRISWHGLSPQIKAMYVRNDSTVPLFQYRRFRGEVSLTGSF